MEETLSWLFPTYSDGERAADEGGQTLKTSQAILIHNTIPNPILPASSALGLKIAKENQSVDSPHVQFCFLQPFRQRDRMEQLRQPKVGV